MKRFALMFSLAAVLLAASVAISAADPPADTAVAAAPVVTSVAQPVAAVPAQTISSQATIPAPPAMPSDHSVMPMILWAIALIGWMAAIISEGSALIPGIKMNGILHGFLVAAGAIKADPDKQTITIDVGEYKALIASASSGAGAGQ